jgi:tetratricopeptide (TPR) repeat protein
MPSDSLHWFTKAIEILTPLHENEPRDQTVSMGLQKCYMNRARAHDRLQQYAEAIQAWGRAIEFSSNEASFELRAGRALSRLRANQVAEAVAEVAELAKSRDGPADVWYDIACVYSISSDKVADKKVEYSQRAVELLKQAVEAGYNDAAHMQQDTDLDPLRERTDFKTLLEKLEKGAETKPDPEK